MWNKLGFSTNVFLALVAVHSQLLHNGFIAVDKDTPADLHEPPSSSEVPSSASKAPLGTKEQSVQSQSQSQSQVHHFPFHAISHNNSSSSSSSSSSSNTVFCMRYKDHRLHIVVTVRCLFFKNICFLYLSGPEEGYRDTKTSYAMSSSTEETQDTEEQYETKQRNNNENPNSNDNTDDYSDENTNSNINTNTTNMTHDTPSDGQQFLFSGQKQSHLVEFTTILDKKFCVRCDNFEEHARILLNWIQVY